MKRLTKEFIYTPIYENTYISRIKSTLSITDNRNPKSTTLNFWLERRNTLAWRKGGTATERIPISPVPRKEQAPRITERSSAASTFFPDDRRSD